MTTHATVNGSIYSASGNIVFVAWDTAGSWPPAVDRALVSWRYPLLPRGVSIEMFCVLTRREDRIHVLFWNPDGTPEDICGNGLRAVGMFLQAEVEGLLVSTNRGPVRVYSQADRAGCRLPWPSISRTVRRDSAHLVDVGTPHLVRMVGCLSSDDFRADAICSSTGIDPVNATFFMVDDGLIRVRTFERGVGETRSCGTGAVAACAVARLLLPTAQVGSPIRVEFASGERLEVSVTSEGETVDLWGACAAIIDSCAVECSLAHTVGESDSAASLRFGTV